MIHRPQEAHCDLGLISDDKTEDLRKARKAVVPTTAQREEQPHTQLKGRVPINTITRAPNRASETVIVAKAWRATDAAKKQARRGIISWKVYREFCAEVDRIKRERLPAPEDAARVAQLDITKSSGEIFSARPTRGWNYQPADFKTCQVPMPGGRVCGWTTRRTIVRGQVYSACPGHDRRDAETFTPAQIAG